MRERVRGKIGILTEYGKLWGWNWKKVRIFVAFPWRGRMRRRREAELSSGARRKGSCGSQSDWYSCVCVCRAADKGLYKKELEPLLNPIGHFKIFKPTFSVKSFWRNLYYGPKFMVFIAIWSPPSHQPTMFARQQYLWPLNFAALFSVYW